MNYDVTAVWQPDAGKVGDMVDYLADDGRVSTGSGLEADGAAVEGFVAVGEGSTLSRLHSFGFSADHDPDDLADAACRLAREHLDGETLVGVHTENEGNNHVHIGEVGSRSECWMDTGDIKRVRSAMADRFGSEQIGVDSSSTEVVA
jgi:hypothetical protein